MSVAVVSSKTDTRLPYRRSSLYMINYMQFKQNNNRY